MSRLRIFDEQNPDTPEFASFDPDFIATELQKIGVTFERWKAAHPLPPGASPDEVMAAYKTDIDRLVSERGFQSVDVASVAPDNPDREAIRAKFLDEHYHKEDEVRFFVAGSGLFTLHVQGKVYEIECMQDDLIAVPDSTPHWFDMGAEPNFIAIRFFTEPNGWVGHVTGEEIAKRFPRYEPGTSS
ncbi:MAG: acireductone dioxygenase [Pseudoxanthomonas sp.]